MNLKKFCLLIDYHITLTHYRMTTTFFDNDLSNGFYASTVEQVWVV